MHAEMAKETGCFAHARGQSQIFESSYNLKAIVDKTPIPE